MTKTEEAARFAAELRFEDIPPRVLSLAKRQLLSLLGAAFAGARTGGVQTIARGLGRAPAANSTNGTDLATARATALALRGRTGVEDAAYLNACASIAHDMDDYVVFGHTGHSAIFASLAVGEALNRSGRDVLVAIVVANELGARLGAACLLGPQNGQLWTYIHQLAGAAASARLLGLDARGTRHAIGLALSQPFFGLWPGFMGPDSKLLTAAEPLRVGIRAAFLAAAGLTGPNEILEGTTGLLGRIPFVGLPGFLTGLGKAWLTETLSIKTLPGCAYMQAPVTAFSQALAQLLKMRRTPLVPDDVERITVRATFLTVEMDRLSHAYIAAVSAGGSTAPTLSPVVVNFSTALSIAIALLDDGELAPAGLDEERLARDQDVILRFARRVSVEHDMTRTATLIHEVDRVLDVAALVAGVPLADLAQGARAQHALMSGRGVGSTLKDTLELIRGLGPAGRTFAQRLVEKRASGFVARAQRSLAKALDEFVPTGDQDHPRHEPPPLETYDLAGRPLASFRALFGASVVIRDRDGNESEASCEVPPGAAGRDDASTDKLVLEKLRRFAAPAIGEAGVNRLHELVSGLEDARDLSALTGVLESVKAVV